jgi:Domain of unknown function (DUF397)
MTWRKASYSTSNGGNCVEVGVWRKASYSTNNGGACVEVGVWRKASYSTSNGGECVEVASARPAAIAVRDSKDPDGPRLAFAPRGWDRFVTEVKTGTFGLS